MAVFIYALYLTNGYIYGAPRPTSAITLPTVFGYFFTFFSPGMQCDAW